MKILFIIILTSVVLFGCDGDCIKCHSKLLKNGKLDERHQILNECKKCHKVTSEDLQKMGSLCGQDCWNCHNIKKVSRIEIKEHLILTQCIKCHTKLKNDNSLYQWLSIK